MVRGEKGTVMKRLVFEDILLDLADDIGNEPSVVIVR